MLIGFLEGDGEKERDRQTDIDVKEKQQWFASCMHPSWDGTCNPDMDLDQKSNRQLFSAWDNTPAN